MRFLPLTNSPESAVISDVDWSFLHVFTWRLKKSMNTWYVVTTVHTNEKVLTIRLHRLIMGVWDSTMDVHHKDHNPLNCHRDNLEIQDAIMHRTSHNRGGQ